MNLKFATVPALFLFLGASCLVSAKALAWQGSPSLSAGFVQDQDRDRDRDRDRGNWEAPPGEFNDIQRRGFHDGVEGARKDVGNHRRPDVNNREEYRNPDVPRGARRAYRDAFRRGYQQGMSHLMGDRDHDRR